MSGSLEESLNETDTTSVDNTKTDSTTTESQSTESSYVDGSYSELVEYNSPGGKDGITVSLEIMDGVVKSVSIENGASNDVSKQYIDGFSKGISSAVVGKSIDSLGTLSAVNGASLTTAAFNSAVMSIRSQAEGA